jgi:hypothetical protein
MRYRYLNFITCGYVYMIEMTSSKPLTLILQALLTVRSSVFEQCILSLTVRKTVGIQESILRPFYPQRAG